LAVENMPATKVKVLEIADDALVEGIDLLAPIAAKVLSELPMIQVC